MKLPKKFRLGGFDVRVSRKKMKFILGGKECRGYYDSLKKEIWVTPEKLGESPEETFWHEFMHAGFHESGIQQVPGWSIDIEEVLAEKFSRYLAEFLKRRK